MAESSGSSQNEPIGPTSNLFTKTTDFIDRHFRVIRYVTVYGLAGVGIVLILRSTYALRKFRNVKDIPRDFVTRHTQLHGHVTEVTDAGHILVDHAPIIKFGKASPGHLPLSLAGVDLNHLAFPWLRDNISDKHIWFKLLRFAPNKDSVSPSPARSLLVEGEKQPELTKDTKETEEISGGQPASGSGMVTSGGEGEETTPVEVALMVLPPDKVLECIITAKKGLLRNMIVNEELVRLGMATVAQVDGLEDDSDVVKLLTRLIRAEVKAKKKGHGIWARPSLSQRLRSYPEELKNRVVASLKGFFSWKSKNDEL